MCCQAFGYDTVKIQTKANSGVLGSLPKFCFSIIKETVAEPLQNRIIYLPCKRKFKTNTVTNLAHEPQDCS